MEFGNLGVLLIVLGIILLVLGFKRNKKVSVQASEGSVAIGGDNSGTILNIGNNSSAPAPTKSHGHGLTYLGIIVELIGIGVTLWHAYHMAPK